MIKVLVENAFSVLVDWGREQYPFSLLAHPQNLLVAAGAGGSKELLVAAFAVHLALLLHKSTVCQGGVAVSTVEFLGVPWHTHGHKEWASGESKQGTEDSRKIIRIFKKKNNQKTFTDKGF